MREPFVLLDDAIRGLYLHFTDPIKILCLPSGATEEELILFLETLESYSQSHFVAGYFTYDLGRFLLGFPSKKTPTKNLALFGVFKQKNRLDHIPSQLQTIDISPSVYDLHFSPHYFGYQQAFSRLQKHLEQGNTYQTNLTVEATFSYGSDPFSLYQAIRKINPVSYGGFLRFPDEPDLLCFSPELFFDIQDNKILCKPIKGTVKRGKNDEDDKQAKKNLQESSQFQAENLMIVDLIRNDLTQISQTGSVKVDELFSVETFPHLHHLVSTVSATLKPNTKLLSILKALLPCGSITGAPKISTMQIIDELEQRSRGVYTGAIGYLSPERSCFNVAIRTLEVNNGHGKMGVGGGVLYGSSAEQEFGEIRLKASFIQKINQSFSLFETMLVINHQIPLIHLHTNRIKESAALFGFSFDPSALYQHLKKNPPTEACCILRVELSFHGHLTYQYRPFSPLPNQEAAQICLYQAERVNSKDVLKQHKTTHRKIFDNAYAFAQNHHCLDAILMNEEDIITEATRWNLWIEKQGVWYTSPSEVGLLPGIARRNLLLEKNGQEKPLMLQDILTADQIYLSNSVRGLQKVSLLVE
jgi:para-aminobenzoate synthetase/4-amino-4-deoxychorismate lyase